jgi:hypothetical protein
MQSNCRCVEKRPAIDYITTKCESVSDTSDFVPPVEEIIELSLTRNDDSKNIRLLTKRKQYILRILLRFRKDRKIGYQNGVFFVYKG